MKAILVAITLFSHLSLAGYFDHPQCRGFLNSLILKGRTNSMTEGRILRNHQTRWLNQLIDRNVEHENVWIFFSGEYEKFVENKFHELGEGQMNEILALADSFIEKTVNVRLLNSRIPNDVFLTHDIERQEHEFGEYFGGDRSLLNGRIVLQISELAMAERFLRGLQARYHSFLAKTMDPEVVNTSDYLRENPGHVWEAFKQADFNWKMYIRTVAKSGGWQEIGPYRYLQDYLDNRNSIEENDRLDPTSLSEMARSLSNQVPIHYREFILDHLDYSEEFSLPYHEIFEYYVRASEHLGEMLRSRQRAHQSGL